MENPATWTPLHHALNKALYFGAPTQANAVLKVLHDHNYDVTLDQVQSIINRHQELLQLHFCGASLESMLVRELATQGNERY